MNVRDIAIPPKVIRKVKQWHHDIFACRRCGTEINEAWFKYCPNCGQKFLSYEYAGVCGWNYEAAEKAMQEVLNDKEKRKLLVQVKENGWLYV